MKNCFACKSAMDGYGLCDDCLKKIYAEHDRSMVCIVNHFLTLPDLTPEEIIEAKKARQTAIRSLSQC